MVERTQTKLNWIEQNLPEGLIVDASWFAKHGYSTALRSHYLSAGWLEQPARRVYRRPRGELSWEQVVISLQKLLNLNLVVGGRTALELQGFAHYLAHHQRDVHLYGPKRPPTWIDNLPINTRFVYRNDARLFCALRASAPPLAGKPQADASHPNSETFDNGLTVKAWGQFNWPMIVSTPERALLELLDELPDRESFDHVDKLVSGLSTLSPRRLQGLLADCQSVKVKRLLFFFADRHHHAWVKRLDKSKIDLGRGKRMLARGGKLDPVYQITVPEDLDGAV